MEALQHWNRHERADAPGSIYRAVKIKQEEKLLPKYLIFQGEIEAVLRKHKESITSFNLAKELVDIYPDYWGKPEHLEDINRLKLWLSK